MIGEPSVNDQNNFALVPRPSSSVEKAKPAAKRILSGMVADTLDLARKTASKEVRVADAQLKNWFRTGAEYYNGWGVSQDYTEAAKWFRKGAEQNDVYAQINLGVCYYNGQGVAKDDVKAVKWWRKAAEQNDALAQYNLGFCYKHGEGVAKDEVEAEKWFRKAAEENIVVAQHIAQDDPPSRIIMRLSDIPRSQKNLSK